MLLSLHCIVPAAFPLHYFAEHCVDIGDMVSPIVSGSILSLCELFGFPSVSIGYSRVLWFYHISHVSKFILEIKSIKNGLVTVNFPNMCVNVSGYSYVPFRGFSCPVPRICS